MGISKLWASSPRSAQGIVVRFVKSGCQPPVVDDLLSALVARLRGLLLEDGLGHYAGCDRFSGETRIHLVSDDADRLVASVLNLAEEMSLTERVRIRISFEPTVVASERKLPRQMIS